MLGKKVKKFNKYLIAMKKKRKCKVTFKIGIKTISDTILFSTQYD